ncbi:hypothetical protein [Pseudoalteromonas marina]|uniref:Uncharacterized protein n=1 Tax=Pseudoalteromonas marina TaxID=267375 RepID=A0ABT9FCR1_9GAMM|nr:hypothetical protein [Pseudoalteromonas marina]MDP2564425.1 hypothetical protein [Pseudoalteromonas marina]
MIYNSQPPKGVVVPDGSTHWIFGAVHPFFKVVMEPAELVMSQLMSVNLLFSSSPLYDALDKEVAYIEVGASWYKQKVYQFYDGEWLFVAPRVLDGGQLPSYKSLDLIELREIEIPQNAPTVQTVYGEGVLLGEVVKGGRVAVDLTQNPFGYRPVYLRQGEITKPAL